MTTEILPVSPSIFDPTRAPRSKVFVVDVDTLYRLNNEVYGYNEDLIVDFEDSSVFAYSPSNLHKLMKNSGMVVIEHYGSTLDNVEWIRLENKPRIPETVTKTLMSNSPSLEFQFELDRSRYFEGSAEETYAYIAARILGPVLKQKVMLSVPHGRRKEYSSLGAFQINVWSTPRSIERIHVPPERIFGHVVKMRSEVFQPRVVSKESGGFLITDGDYVVAELLPNALYIHHDAVHYDSDDCFALFAKILLEVVKLRLNPEEYEAKMAEFRLAYLKEQQDALAHLAEKSIPRRAVRDAHIVAEAERELHELKRQAFELERKLFGLRAAQTDPQRIAQRFRDEIAKIQNGSVAQVKEIVIDITGGKPVISIFTEELTLVNPPTGHTHLLGHYEIKFYLDSGAVRFFNLDRQIPGQAGNQQHPHVRDNGSPCLGNVEREFPAYIANYEIEAATTLALAYLGTIVPGDGWADSVINKYPIVGQATSEAARAAA